MLKIFMNNSVKKISPSEAVTNIQDNKNITLLDVRTPEEYREVRIPRSINVPLDRIHQVSKKIPGKDQIIYVYCHSGARAVTACKKLIKMGYKEVYNLGGIIYWNYEVISGK